MPSRIVFSPFKFEEYCKDSQKLVERRGLKVEKVGNNYPVHKRSRQFLFAEGGIGASNFADASYILCHCKNVEEIIFVGTGGGIGEHLESADINVPPECIQLDKVLEIFLPPKAPAKADPELLKRISQIIKKEVRTTGITVHNKTHATVPFFLSETKKLLTDLQKQGAHSLDMELSVLYALANHWNKKAVGIIRIGDLPLKGLPTWKSRSYKRQLKNKVHEKILNGVLTYLF